MTSKRCDQPRTADGRFDRYVRQHGDLRLVGGECAAFDSGADDCPMPESEWDEYNADGTYSYPPEPVCAEQVIAFWRRCPIPDAVLAQVQRAHLEVRRLLVQAHLEKAHPSSSRPRERMFNGESRQSAAEWDRVHEGAAASAEAHFPPAPMPAGQVRSLVRAMRAVDQAYSSSLAEEEYKRVKNESAGLTWDEQSLTWGNVCYLYGESHYPERAWQDPAIRDTGKLDQVTQQLADLTEAVNRIRDGQDADFLTRGKSPRQAERALRDAGYTKS